MDLDCMAYRSCFFDVLKRHSFEKIFTTLFNEGQASKR